MSRMLAYVARDAMTPIDALGADLHRSFVALARLHRDGWGIARRQASGRPASVSTGLTPASEGLSPRDDESARIAIAYLRFASAAAAVTPENLQPFLAGGIAFAHNGALAPADRVRTELTGAERESLRGTTDSEMYFALVRRQLRSPRRSLADAVAEAAGRVRSLYPEACLNAFLIVDDSLVVVHSRGSVAPPLAAFAARGARTEDLPRGHDETYNTLSTTILPSGARAVATTGVDVTTWQRLEDDTVSVFSPRGDDSWAPIPR